MRVIKFIILGVFLLGLLLIGVAIFQGATFDEIFTFGVDDRGFGDEVEHIFEEISTDVSLDLTDRHIIIHLVDEDAIRMTYYPHEKDTWTFEDDTQGISARQRRTAEFRFFSFGIASRNLREVHVYLPDHLVYKLDLMTTTGQIDLLFEENQTFEDVSLKATTGRIRVSNIDVLEMLKIRATTGNVTISDVVANDIDGILTTGDASIDGFESQTFKWVSTTGKTVIKNGVLLSTLDVTTTTGRITVYDVTATAYDLSATTGDISVSLETLSNLYYDLSTTTGHISILGVNVSKQHVTAPNLSQDVYMRVRVTTGEIEINTIS